VLPAIPPIIRSAASLTSFFVIVTFLYRVAKIAASFNKLAKSAPEKPGVRFAN
jgi:hypothetical protein